MVSEEKQFIQEANLEEEFKKWKLFNDKYLDDIEKELNIIKNTKID